MSLVEAAAAPRTKGPSAADQRRGEVIDAAARLFTRSGYYGTGMQDIASEVGLAKPSLYHYFTSKQQILWAIFQETMELLRARRVARAGLAPGEQLRAIIADQLELQGTNPAYAHAWFELQGQLTARQRGIIRKRQEANLNAIKQLLADGLESGEFRAVDPSLFAQAASSITATAYRWFDPGGPLTAREVGNAFAGYLISGIQRPSTDGKPHQSG